MSTSLIHQDQKSLHHSYNRIRIKLALSPIITEVSILILVFTICGLGENLFSQHNNLGIPLIENYGKEVYGGDTQSWDIEYHNKGHLCVANNEGLLIFNGTKWDIYPLPNKSIVRSLSVERNKIYVGGQDEIGFFSSKNNQSLKFTSLKERIPKLYRDLEDIWEIEAFDEKVFFRSKNMIYKITKDSCEVYGANGSITFMKRIGDKVFYNDFEKGMFCIQNGKPFFVEGSEIFQYYSIVDLIESRGRIYILTEKNGVFILRDGNIEPWFTENDDFFRKNWIASGVAYNDDELCIGTLLGGLAILDTLGSFKYVLTIDHGLQNNCITGLVVDNQSNIWTVSLDGIDWIGYGKPVSSFLPDGKLSGAVYDVVLWEDHLFFGTNNGLYYLPFRDQYDPFVKQEANLVPGTEGQVWGLNVVGGELLMGHNEGAFTITKEFTAKKISREPGAWKFIEVGGDKMVVGTYTGLDLYEKKREGWRFKKKLAGFSESSRILVFDENETLWVTHPYRGVYRIRFADDFERIIVEKIKAEDLGGVEKGFYAHDIDGGLVIANEEKILSYDYERKRLLPPNSLLDSLHRIHKIRRLLTYEDDIWYISETGLGCLEGHKFGIESKYFVRHYPEFASAFVGGFENLFFLDDKIVFLCTDDGIQIFDQEKRSRTKPLEAHVDRIELKGIKDSTLYAGYFENPESYQLRHRENHLVFSVSANRLSNNAKVEYAYKLNGTEGNWSDWTNYSKKEYSNLPSGEYEFLVKTRELTGEVSEPTSVKFIIDDPWYMSSFARIGWLVILGLILLLLIVVPKRKHKKETELLQSKQKETEKEVKRLKQENLEKEINFKNQELASVTMHLLQKNETLISLKEDLQKLEKDLTVTADKKRAKKLIKMIEVDTRLQEDWDNFAYHFDQVHRNFLKRIKDGFPKLTPKDLQLSAYLRMNLSTKEIAPLLNISIRGVEIHRYRLRKKLELPRDTNLNEFMIHF